MHRILPEPLSSIPSSRSYYQCGLLISINAAARGRTHIEVSYKGEVLASDAVPVDFRDVSRVSEHTAMIVTAVERAHPTLPKWDPLALKDGQYAKARRLIRSVERKLSNKQLHLFKPFLSYQSYQGCVVAARRARRAANERDSLNFCDALSTIAEIASDARVPDYNQIACDLADFTFRVLARRNAIIERARV